MPQPVPPVLERLHGLLAGRDAPAGLAAAYAALSARYRQGVNSNTPALRDDAEGEAYLQTRMPATCAAVVRALELGLAHCHPPLATLLDLGAGTGAACWAATTVIANLRSGTALERDPGQIERGQSLAAASGLPFLEQLRWLPADLTDDAPLPRHDLVICSYALNELAAALRPPVVARAWAACKEALLLVEAGTPRGFAVIAKARAQLVEAGAHIAGPCPHHGPCPLLQVDEWCHLPVRLPRSRLHRRAKGGDRGWEDEPVSWLLCTRQACDPCRRRVIDRPQANKAAVRLRCCQPEGIAEVTIGRRHNDYRQARRIRWGDAWDAAPDQR